MKHWADLSCRIYDIFLILALFICFNYWCSHKFVSGTASVVTNEDRYRHYMVRKDIQHSNEVSDDLAIVINCAADSCSFGLWRWENQQNDVRPAKTQISLGICLVWQSLGICPVWSESLLCTQWVAKDPSFLHAESEDSDQTGRMPRLIWVFAGQKCHFVGFVMRLLIWAVRTVGILGTTIQCFRTELRTEVP